MSMLCYDLALITVSELAVTAIGHVINVSFPIAGVIAVLSPYILLGGRESGTQDGGIAQMEISARINVAN